MTRICILSFSPAKTDPRVLRQVDSLKDLADVTLLGYGFRPDAEADFRPISPEYSGVLGKSVPRFALKVLSSMMLILGFNWIYYWTRPHTREALRLLRGEKFDLVIANNFETVPLARLITKGKAPIILDAQEFTPDEFSKGFLTTIFRRYRVNFLVKAQLPYVDKVFTVSKTIADAYEAQFGISGVELLLNAPAFEALQPSESHSEKIHLVHHGIASRGRHLEKTIEAMRFLKDEFTLTFMLMPSEPSYLEELKELARNLPVVFLDPVPTEKISQAINKYDAGVFLHHDETVNAEYCLPNKFFEYIQGRLAIVIGPSSEMARIVKLHNLGLVSSEFTAESFASTLSELSHSRIAAFKKNSAACASEYCWDVEAKKLLSAVKSLTEA